MFFFIIIIKQCNKIILLLFDYFSDYKENLWQK